MHFNNVSRLFRLALMSSLSLAGCGGAEAPGAEEHGFGVATQALSSTCLIGRTCTKGPWAQFRFTGKARTYFVQADGTKRFNYEYTCGNGTTDVCGPVTLTPWIANTEWQSHVVESDYPILYNGCGCAAEW